VGIEWFRDLSVTILGFVTTAVLIFVAVLAYGLYRKIMSTLFVVKAASKAAYDTLTTVQEAIKPLFPILNLFQGISGGLKNFMKIFRKESNEKGDNDE
jgi:hypothetical protein